MSKTKTEVYLAYTTEDLFNLPKTLKVPKDTEVVAVPIMSCLDYFNIVTLRGDYLAYVSEDYLEWLDPLEIADRHILDKGK